MNTLKVRTKKPPGRHEVRIAKKAYTKRPNLFARGESHLFDFRTINVEEESLPHYQDHNRDIQLQHARR